MYSYSILLSGFPRSVHETRVGHVPVKVVSNNSALLLPVKPKMPSPAPQVHTFHTITTMLEQIPSIGQAYSHTKLG
jgi:hypothetical protein